MTLIKCRTHKLCHATSWILNGSHFKIAWTTQWRIQDFLQVESSTTVDATALCKFYYQGERILMLKEGTLVWCVISMTLSLSSDLLPAMAKTYHLWHFGKGSSQNGKFTRVKPSDSESAREWNTLAFSLLDATALKTGLQCT